MGFREVSVTEIREVLRLRLRGRGLREIARSAQVDRKTVRRYLDAAVALGFDAAGDEAQLTDRLIGGVCEAVRPHRPEGHGAAWTLVAGQKAAIVDWLGHGITLTKVHTLLARHGVVVPYRTLHRYAADELSFGRQPATVRVADGDPGVELQVDFGEMGLLRDPQRGRRRRCWALIFTACYSRHTFVWLSHRQTTETVIEGCEAAWSFFGGVFRVLVPDNLTPVVTRADPMGPRFNEVFREYAQARGFEIDACRVATPTDKPRVERTVQFVRGNFWAGEHFEDISDAQRRAEAWCRDTAGMRVHGTTQVRPLEMFRTLEAPHLLAAPDGSYDIPHWADAKVHRDHHIEALKSLYSIPGERIGQMVRVRCDRTIVKVYHRGVLIKVHPRQAPGGRRTDSADLPQERTAYALRDVASLRRQAAGHGAAIGTMAEYLLDSPLPWTRMRQVYCLLGLVRRYGAERVNEACRRALDVDAVDVRLVARMLERATESSGTGRRPIGILAGRFARDASEFAVAGRMRE